MAVAGEVLAIDVSAGTSGFLIVVLLCLAAAGIFTLMFGSLRRLRGNVESGEFDETTKRRGSRGATDGAADDGAATDEASQSAPAGVPGPRGADDKG